jgi:hypothetical protein
MYVCTYVWVGGWIDGCVVGWVDGCGWIICTVEECSLR